MNADEEDLPRLYKAVEEINSGAQGVNSGHPLVLPNTSHVRVLLFAVLQLLCEKNDKVQEASKHDFKSEIQALTKLCDDALGTV